MLPQVFIGSSKESLKIARAVKKSLADCCKAVVWDQGVFKLSKTTLESLLEQLKKTDFAVYIFSPDDISYIRDQKFSTVRDNVIYELGLFTGRLGRGRAYILIPKNCGELHLPTDLLGITVETYDPEMLEDNAVAAVGDACFSISELISDMGVFVSEELSFLQHNVSQIHAGSRDRKELEGFWLSRFDYKTSRKSKTYDGYQYGLEYFSSYGSNLLGGGNIICAASSGEPYFHRHRVILNGRFLVGTWTNENTDNLGCLQLSIQNKNRVMYGLHLGNSDDNSIQAGNWTWVKVASQKKISSQEADRVKRNYALRDLCYLDANFEKWTEQGDALELDAVTLAAQ